MKSGSVKYRASAPPITLGYVGRFAPTPSGPLHLGSLATAVASYLDAHANDGTWLLRIDDLDTPRLAKHAERTILQSLEAHGLHWDGHIAKQSDHVEAYREALERLVQRERVFYCRCSRKDTVGVPQYPGTCRSVRNPPAGSFAIRARVGAARERFIDVIQGRVEGKLASIDGDFLVWRRDGLASYSLAVVVDDHLAGVTHVVRGADLMLQSLNHIFLMGQLGLPMPRYAHLPLLVERNFVKLSKHTGSFAVNNRHAEQNLASVLQLLGLEPPPRLACSELIEWAVTHWTTAGVAPGMCLGDFVCIGVPDCGRHWSGIAKLRSPAASHDG